MQKTIIWIVFVVGIIGGGLWFFNAEAREIFFGAPVNWVRVGGAQIFVSIADTPETRMQGLSGTERLGEFEGKLFIFDTVAPYGIWMKDMQYAIDIVWVDDNLSVVHVESKVSPDTYPKTFTPSQPARYVLEINAGVAEAYQIRVGDTVSFSKSLTKRHKELLSK